MSGKAGTLESFALLLGQALKPLAKVFDGDASVVFSRLGIVPNADFFNTGTVSSALAAAASSATALATSVDALDIAIQLDDSLNITLHGAESLDKIATVLSSLATLGSGITAAAQSDATLTPNQKLHIQNLAKELPERLLALMVVDQLVTQMPKFAVVLALLGLLDITTHPGDLTDPISSAYIERAIRLDRLKLLITHPLEHFQALYSFGLPTFDGLDLFLRLKTILDNRYEQARIITEVGQPNVLQAPSFVLAVDQTTNPPGLVYPLRFGVTGATSVEFVNGDWVLKLQRDGQFGSGAMLKLSPSSQISIVPSWGTATLSFSISLTADRSVNPFTLLGTTNGSYVTVESIGFNASLNAIWDPASGNASADPIFSADFKRGKLQISTKGADGFIAKILSGFEVKSDFDFGIGYSLAGGLYFQGSSALEVQLASHVSFGPITINALTLVVSSKDGMFPISVATDFQTVFGPLTAVVQGFGFGIDVALVSENKGNLGPVDIQPRFRPPKGVSLSMDAGGFKGGGFLAFDHEKGEYAGVLELDFQGLVSVKAVGVINTKMPDGAPGFSLLLVISAEFTPLQLSFGFTLNGVGGIIGLNRTIVVDALAEGIRTNAIKSILFPENIIANITRIISDIKQFFPPQQDHFVIGPMVKLGWGTPSIVTVELGILLDLPNPMFAIVGVLKAVLPEENAPILRLQVNFIGILDFNHGYVFFRADLYDSRLLAYSITGSMAFLVSWGEQQTFALSVGGFHPDFRDIPSIPALPDGFRNMARIGISLLSDDNPRLKVESYFAVTSNTVQFGAKVELYAEAAGFNVYGFLGYDVLFQFDPFRFIARLYGGIALREGSSVIAGINISAQLSGPTPWDAQGKASLTILFFEINVRFHVTWGDPPPAIESATEDLLRLLKRELSDTRNWRAELPSNNHLHVCLKKIDPPVGEKLLVIHPAGVLTFSQRSLPLEDYLIQKFGNKKPLNENKFKLTNANSNGTVIPADYQGVREQFAPSNFTELSDSDKLSRRSFDTLPSGFRLTATSDLLVAKPPVPRPVKYELTYLRRKQFRLEFRRLIELASRTYERLVKGSAVRQSVLSLQQNRKSLNAPAEVVLPAEKFAVANVSDLKSHVSDGKRAVLFATQAEAYQRQQELIEQNPALAGQIQVVSHYELNKG